LIFFKFLINKYLILKEKVEDIELEVDSSIFEKNEDSFDKYYTKVKVKISKDRKEEKYH
jgi:hypothetical protein